MKDSKEILENTICRWRKRNIIMPTYEEMAHPEKIPKGIKEELKNISLWDLNPRNLFRITWKKEWDKIIREFNQKTGLLEKYQ